MPDTKVPQVLVTSSNLTAMESENDSMCLVVNTCCSSGYGSLVWHLPRSPLQPRSTTTYSLSKEDESDVFNCAYKWQPGQQIIPGPPPQQEDSVQNLFRSRRLSYSWEPASGNPCTGPGSMFAASTLGHTRRLRIQKVTCMHRRTLRWALPSRAGWHGLV